MPHAAPFHLLLLRHGQTDANATGVLQGHQPTPLNALGRLQAQRLAFRIATHVPKVAVVVSSDLARAAQTAAPVAALCGLTPVLDAGWRERGFGSLEGRTVGERETWRAAHGDTHPPGGESVAAFRARVLAALEQVTRRHAHDGETGAAAVVTHGGPIGIVLRLLAEGTLPLAEGNGAKIDLAGAPNCSILELIREPARTATGFDWRIACLSDVQHLEGLVTEADSG